MSRELSVFTLTLAISAALAAAWAEPSSGTGDLTDPFNKPPDYFVSGDGARVVAYEPTPIILAQVGASEGGAQAAAPAGTETAAKSTAPFAAFDGAVAADTLTRDMMGKQLAITGTIAKYEASTGDRVPFRLTLVDRETDPVMVVYWPDVAPRIHGTEGKEPEVGLQVSVRGALSDYRGVMQVRVANPNNLRIQGLTAAGEDEGGAKLKTALKALATGGDKLTVSEALAKEPGSGMVTVFGEVESFRAAWNDRAPNIITVTDGEASLDVVYFSNEIESMPEELTKPGAMIRAKGVRSDFQGKKQLRVRNAEAVAMADAAEGGAAADAAAAMGGDTPALTTSVGLTRSLEGKEVAMAATLTRLNDTPAGTFLVLKDDDGVAVAFLDKELAATEGLRERLVTGSKLLVAGKGEFSRLRSQMVLRVDSADSIRKIE
ncbi:MAG: hypothetical protein SF028_13245 [Candidatus Sumerlaeia bacterium]|nr:hypothetical protein [Candidatus Sumerlaeia bacterium]